MSVQDSAFSLLAKIIKVISLKNIAIWSFAALVVLVGYTVFENRGPLVSYLVNGPTINAPSIIGFKVSSASQARVKQLVDIDDLINSIVIMNADIRNNRRVPLYWYSDDVSVQKTLDGTYAGLYGGIPLFTAEEKNNENVVGVINGEFACSEYAAGNTAVFPGLLSRMPFICRASLPPYYGQFSGFVAISLNRKPSPDELIVLKSETLSISTEIFFRDIVPSQHISKYDK
ncbi:hypothetical protein [Acinetobacter sp.]|uniref:hypothetical protein n=1 Tax=Acinetobacter sp. TaxID=472 RepID=UPI003890136D